MVRQIQIPGITPPDWTPPQAINQVTDRERLRREELASLDQHDAHVFHRHVQEATGADADIAGPSPGRPGSGSQSLTGPESFGPEISRNTRNSATGER